MALASFAVASVLAVSGCSSIPKSISGDGAVSPATYKQLSQAPDRYQGQDVRIGGKVINVINLPHRTIIEVAVLTLNDSARPEIKTPYQGRVLVYADKFLDPDNFRHRYITVLGKVSGTEEHLIGQQPYRFLKITLMGYQTWHLENTFMPDDGWIYAWSPAWGIAPPPGYFYGGPEVVNQDSYLVP